MKTIKELLVDADPLRHEPPIADSRREALRQAVVASTFAGAPGAVSARFHLARLAMVSIVVLAMFLLGSRIWPGMGFETYAAVRFEVRLAEDKPAPGLREVKLSGSDRVIYIHQEVVVGNADVARAEVVPGRDTAKFVVGIRFTMDGARKMLAATKNHIGKPIAILVDDVVVMAPTLRSAIGESAEINGDFSQEQAERIVNGIN